MSCRPSWPDPTMTNRPIDGTPFTTTNLRMASQRELRGMEKCDEQKSGSWDEERSVRRELRDVKSSTSIRSTSELRESQQSASSMEKSRRSGETHSVDELNVSHSHVHSVRRESSSNERNSD